MTTELGSKFNAPCPMGAGCNHAHPHHCKQAVLENSDAYKNEMARRANLSGVFHARRDTAGGMGDSLSPRFTTGASGVVIVNGPAPEESESAAKDTRKLITDHSDIEV
jgi:hypothetical protein